MWTAVFALVQSVVTGLVGPVFTYLGKKQDTQLDGFKSAAGIDQVAYQSFLTYQIQITAAKAAAKSWWGARLLYMVVGLAAVLHASAVFLDTTFTFGTGHYGSLAIPKLPDAYFEFEKTIVYSLFVVSTIAAPISAVTSWLHRP